MSVQVLAKAEVTRTGRRFTRDNYTVRLTLNGIDTGLHVHCGRKDRKDASLWLVDNANELLDDAGLLDVFVELFEGPKSTAGTGLFTQGSKVKLAVELGPKYPVGTTGTIVRVDEDEETDSPENYYPYLFAPDGVPGVEIPVGRSEVVA
jgi:hypothetical protein